MSNEIEEILEDDEVIDDETEDKTEDKVVDENKSEKKKMDLSYLDKPVDEWTTEDALNAQRATKTLQFQKKHFQEKAKTVKVEAQPIKNNSEQQINVLEEMDKRFLKKDGLTDEDIEQLKFIQSGFKSQGKDITLIEAQENSLFKSYQESKLREEKKVKAQLITNGSGVFKDGKEMTTEERVAARDSAAKALLDRM